MVNKVRVGIGAAMLGVPLVGGILFGSIWGLTKVPWHLIDWKVGLGLAVTSWIVIAGLFLWSGSQDNKKKK